MPNTSEQVLDEEKPDKQDVQVKMCSSDKIPEQSTGTSFVPTPQHKRFRFTETYDLYLLRAVRLHDAHVPKWGELDIVYEKVLETFIKYVPSTVFLYSNKPSTKTLVDRFKRIIALRRKEDKNDLTKSGVEEIYGERENLLDDLILEIDEKERSARAQKAEQTAKEERLERAGEEIREKALKRASTTEDTEDGVSVRRRKVRRKAKFEESLNEEEGMTGYLLQQEDRRQQIESDRVNIEKEKLAAEQKEATQRLQIARERFDLEKKERMQALEERSLAIAERKQFLTIIEKLSRKLE